MVTIPVIFHNMDYYGKQSAPEARSITAATREECFAEFFKANNRLKYCNGTYFEFANKADHDEYHNQWYSLRNYVLNGGCMD